MKQIKDEGLKKAVARAFELEEGKGVLVEFPKLEKVIRLDYRCMDKDTDVCNKCGLRFTCYSSQYLVIPFETLYQGGRSDIEETINEKAENYIKG